MLGVLRVQDRASVSLGMRSIVNMRQWDFSCPAAPLIDAILAQAHALMASCAPTHPVRAAPRIVLACPARAAAEWGRWL